jgi:spore maturation protein CgeB
MSQPRTIAFFGSSDLLSQTTPVATCLRGIMQGLQGRGFQFTFFAPRCVDGRRNGDDHEATWIRLAPYRADTEQGFLDALQEAATADIIIKSSRAGVFDSRLDRSVLDVAPPRTQVVFWDLDPTRTLNRLRTNPDDPFRALIPKYDLILTSGGGETVSHAYLRLGARRCVPIDDGLAPEVGDSFAPPFPADARLDLKPGEQGIEHRVRELEVILRPAALHPLPA